VNWMLLAVCVGCSGRRFWTR